MAIAGRPVARRLDDGKTLEVLRVCTDGTPNANSFLYGRVKRIAQLMGYEKIITYTLEEESGASLRAVGAGRGHGEAEGVERAEPPPTNRTVRSRRTVCGLVPPGSPLAWLDLDSFLAGSPDGCVA